MQNQVLVQKEENSFKVHADLDVENSVFLTKLLFEYVSQGKITFELTSKKGSITSEFLVSVIGGVVSAVLYDLAKKIYYNLREEKQKGKKLNPVYFFLLDKEYVITGGESDILPKES